MSACRLSGSQQNERKPLLRSLSRCLQTTVVVPSTPRTGSGEVGTTNGGDGMGITSLELSSLRGSVMAISFAWTEPMIF